MRQGIIAVCMLGLLILTAGCAEEKGTLAITIKDSGQSSANINAPADATTKNENATQYPATQITNDDSAAGNIDTEINETENNHETDSQTENVNYNSKTEENSPKNNNSSEQEISVKDYLSIAGINVTEVTSNGKTMTINVNGEAGENEKETAEYVFAISAAVAGEEITELVAEISKNGETLSYSVQRSKANDFSEGKISLEEFENAIKIQ